MNRVRIHRRGRSVNSNVMVVGVDVGKGVHVAVGRRRDGSFTSAFKFRSDARGFNDFWGWLCEWREKVLKGF